MFGVDFLAGPPIVQVSMDGTLDPEKEWALGKAVDELRHVERMPSHRDLMELLDLRGS